ncbi:MULTISPECIES: ClbS/DfsB family four-helix bundle protein [unclassified Brenneria]|uniref:ClbS/DfsB family four-helix bundle protein n=1 Tax=unclassified Brenneria TaxID=2634434 RepID=UPI0029C42280|nr:MULTISPECIES: ClbS/DfsB family four-helix bundle protein [unclassified Brenneria]MDX5627561.1 ClbS/DfsB family four-helix bundle protein [Brenneria sp. L3-3Z]MDX5694283.1 ClbS/DfsB family four-helix bundle protein [Brenneria sp. L4-2C]MEE3662134.1 ClbS/DfsB family four-helix bundle protein [Brenneria sp. g21c3]
MAVPQTKTELLSEIDKTFNKLIGYLDIIPPALAEGKSMPGHAKDTIMSVGDLVSYLLGWNKLVVKWITRDESGQPVDFPETGYKWNQLGLLAQKFYADFEKSDYAQRIEALKAEKNRIVELIAARSDEELYGKSWYGKWTMGRMISFNTSSPYANACGRLRKWAKERQFKLK